MVMFERVRRMVDAWFRRSRKGPARRNIYDGGRQLSRKWRGDPPPADSAVRQPLSLVPWETAVRVPPSWNPSRNDLKTMGTLRRLHRRRCD
jgi:hypothetical protein